MSLARVAAIGTTVALVGLWELLTRTSVLPPELPPVSSTLDWLGQELTTGDFWTSLGLTMWHWGAGLLLGAVAGMAVGVVIGVAPLLRRLLQTPLEFLRPIPPVVYLPLFILVLGSTSKTAIILVAIGAFWPMLFQSYYGVAAVEPMALETGRVFGLSRRQRLLSITLRSIMPYVATGLRISSSLALVIAVSIELIGGVPGLGADLAAYGRNAVYVGIYGTLFVSGVVGLTLNGILESAERRLLRWHVPNRVTGA